MLRNTIPWAALGTALILAGACSSPTTPLREPDRDFRGDMRSLVADLAARARTESPGFLVVPQNGGALVTLGDDDPGAPLASDYLEVIDGLGREDLEYGYDGDGVATGAADRQEMLSYLDLAAAAGKTILVIDYPWVGSDTLSSGAQARAAAALAAVETLDSGASPGHFVGTVVPRDLNFVPPAGSGALTHENSADINTLADAQNLLFFANPGGSQADYLGAIAASGYDLVVIDAYGTKDDDFLSASQVAALQTKPQGGRRLVLAYFSIGEAESYRSYWHSSWKKNPPSWLGPVNPDWAGNYKVRYWQPAWQTILHGVLDRLTAAGFDGVYLDIIDAYEFWEART